MEKQPVPNSSLILVFGILSIVTCCCYGVLGLIFGIVALVLARKAEAVYRESPDIYTGYNSVKTGRILAIIGIVLSVLYLVATIVLISIYGMEGIQELQEEMMREYGQEYGG